MADRKRNEKRTDTLVALAFVSKLLELIRLMDGGSALPMPCLYSHIMQFLRT